MDSAAFQSDGAGGLAAGFGMLQVLGCHPKLLCTGGDEGGQNDLVLLQVKDSPAKKENATKLNIKNRIT